MSNNNNNDFYDYWNESDSAEEIREPDRVYFDRLIDNRDDEDIEMEKIIYESFTLAEKKGEEQMKEQIEELIGEMNIRKEKFSNILYKSNPHTKPNATPAGRFFMNKIVTLIRVKK